MQPAATRAFLRSRHSILIAALLALAPVLPVGAQTKSKKKAVSTESPSTKKKPAAPETEKPKPQPEAESPSNANSTAVQNASISAEELVEFHHQPAAVRQLIESSLALARKNLTYTFGSADPDKGGMDCSGFIYYVLRQHGFTQVPRDSSGLYLWTRKAHGFRAVMSRKPDNSELDELLPGDLLFWIGTYATDHDPPISHTMLYLGTEKSGGGKVMIGSSDGRTYHGKKRNGVSVFDFIMPRAAASGEQRATFVGYARIPGLRD